MEQIHFKNLVCFLYCSTHLLLCIWKTLWSCLWFVVLCLMGGNLFVNFSSGHCWNIHTWTTSVGTLACDPLISTCSWDEVAAVCPPPALVLVFHCGCSHCLGHLLSPPVPVLYGLALEIVSFWECLNTQFSLHSLSIRTLCTGHQCWLCAQVTSADFVLWAESNTWTMQNLIREAEVPSVERCSLHWLTLMWPWEIVKPSLCCLCVLH